MAEITVDYYNPNGVPSSAGKFTLMPRSQGFEWKTTGEFKMVAFTPKMDFSPIKVILKGNNSYISNKFMTPNMHLLNFNEADVMKIYNFLCEKMEWSPEAISEGTAHPNLMAASDRFSTGKRRTRKARK